MLRLLLMLALVYGVSQVVRRAAASWFVGRASRAASLPGSLSPDVAANLRRAMLLDPADPQHPALLARTLQYSLESDNVLEVIRLHERAVALGPHRAQLWVELGAAYEWAGRADAAQRAYEHALALFPNSPEINWQLGNYSLRADHTHEAARFLRTCALRSAELRRPVFDLAWRATQDASYVLNEIVPPQTETLLAYLDYLSETRRLDAAADVWSRLRGAGLAFTPAVAFRYFEALIEQRRTVQLESAWAALAAAHPGTIPPSGPGENLLVNGDFESEPVSGGRDWRLMQAEGVDARTVTSAFYAGTRSLEIDFTGTENIYYQHVVQFVPVLPGTRYRFTVYMRAAGITTDSGPRLQIHEPHNPLTLPVTLLDMRGTATWSPVSAEFVTGPATTLLSVRVIRLPSEKFARQFRGSIWLDHLSLVPLP